jgi:hypothetical protein
MQAGTQANYLRLLREFERATLLRLPESQSNRLDTFHTNQRLDQAPD